jgi:polysaccharide chain length determinant protein (PEP-CTERM system associated)
MKNLMGLEVTDYLGIIWKRRWYVVIPFVLVTAGVSYYARSLVEVYRSEMRILVESPFISEDFVRPTVRTTADDRISSIRQQIASRTFLERIIEQFQIDGYGTRPDFVMEETVRDVRQRIGIERTSNDTFTLSFVDRDPKFAQTATKQLGDELIRLNTALRMDKVIVTDQFLDRQLRQAEQELTAQEEKIKQFKMAHLGELPEQASANLNNLSSLNSQLGAAENALQQARYQQKLLDFRVQQSKRAGALSVGTAEKKENPLAPLMDELAAKRSQRNAILAKYTAKHPDAERVSREILELEQQLKEGQLALDAEKNSDVAELTPLGDKSKNSSQAMVDNEQGSTADQGMDAFAFEAQTIKGEIQKRENEKQDILAQIRTIQAKLNLTPALEQELSALFREQDNRRQKYSNLQSKKFNSQMSATVETDKKNETYKIIDEANLPVKPVYPNRTQIILLGIGGGFAIGIAAAFGREFMDSTISSEEEAVAVLNLPILAIISEIPRRKGSIRKLIGQEKSMA